uniref:Uncharacterized protein n=1 Tax=Meloidogyne javanica TaxID=6303 RepID=A0A915MM01_MELJA
MIPRKITRSYLNISELYLTVRDIMEQVGKVVKISPEYMVACKIKPNGQSYLVADNLTLESDNQLNDFTILEIPDNNKQYGQELINAIVNFSLEGKIFGEPYISLFYKDLTYRQLCFELMKDGAPLLPKHFYKMNLDFKLHLLDSDGSVYCTLDKLKQTFHGAIYHCDPATLKPFLNSHVDK